MKYLISLISIFFLTACQSKKTTYEHNSAKSGLLILRSNSFFKINKLDSAKYYINQALLLDSLNCGAYNNRAILKFKENRPSNEVIFDFETSLRLCPGFETALYSLANYYYEIKDYKKVIKACNSYELQSDKIDSIHIREINGLNSIALQKQKLIGNISISQAVSFYDSVNSTLESANSLQMRFNTNLTAICKRIMLNEIITGEFDYLNVQFDSLMLFRKKAFNEISELQEIDSTLNYKLNVLNYLTIVITSYEACFSRLLYCFKTRDVILIRNCLASMNPFSIKIKKAQNDLKMFKKDFEKKYEL
jgi:hypothetical protein